MSLKRKPHRKSRNGCRECKRRRIKCDEEKPGCGHCVRHNVHCIYPAMPASTRTPSSLSASEHTLSPAGKGATPQAISPHITPCIYLRENSAVPSGAYFKLKDMALLHHWSLSTSLSMIKSPPLNHFWQKVFPEIAFHHAYVMHSILSIAALHVTYLCTSNRHEHICYASHHNTLALRSFREGINSLGPDNSDALFASATLAFFYAFVRLGRLYEGDGEDDGPASRTSRILGAEWIPLVRGMEAVLHPVYDYVRTGPLRSLLGLGNFFEIDPDAQPGPDDEALLQLQEVWASDEKSQVYDDTLHLMRRTSAWMVQFRTASDDQLSEWGYNREWSGPFAWLFLASERYFVLLQQRQPPALVLFAYFGALIQRLNGYWWADGCGKSIVSAVAECLGPYWSSWLQWPKEFVGLG
ncbi:hypothetical protein BS50DRAFT_538129 [Corynespora cassiicola Philippines]|uniref:Zn(2)-C6 fungal-type domain-containing protein n=1 Tax=Corynespora cassiicola Philippines TaxID=1448308 RepID=A0A2T2N0G1_CORCC|nr:hypothetical protein BS50DRAFT_538129 [Corynespora cassiicola Philippines]